MPSLPAGKVVLGIVIAAAVVAVVTESSNAASTTAAYGGKDRSVLVMDAILQYDTYLAPLLPPQPPVRPMREPDEAGGREEGNGSLGFPPPSVRGLFGLSSDIFYAFVTMDEEECESGQGYTTTTDYDASTLVNHVRSYNQIKKINVMYTQAS